MGETEMKNKHEVIPTLKWRNNIPGCMVIVNYHPQWLSPIKDFSQDFGIEKHFNRSWKIMTN